MSVTRIFTAEELDAILTVAGEEAEPVVVREGSRFWILTEDEDGQWWAWSWREEGEDGKPVRIETLELPLVVIYRPAEATPPKPAGMRLCAIDDLEGYVPEFED